MESSDYNGSDNNRSFIAFRPIAYVAIDHGTARFEFPDDTSEEHTINDDYTVATALEEFISRFEVHGEGAQYCGLYGYTSFNIVRHTEHIAVRDSSAKKNDAPDLLYILYKYVVVFHDRNHEMILTEIRTDDEPSRLDEIERRISNRNFPVYDFRAEGSVAAPSPTRSTLPTSTAALPTACAATSSRSYFRAASYSLIRATTSSSTVRCAPSTLRHISSTSISAVSASSAPRPRPTAASRGATHGSTP